jgi:hypothetical protein
VYVLQSELLVHEQTTAAEALAQQQQLEDLTRFSEQIGADPFWRAMEGGGIDPVAASRAITDLEAPAGAEVRATSADDAFSELVDGLRDTPETVPDINAEKKGPAPDGGSDGFHGI